MTEDTQVEIEQLLGNIRSQFYTTTPDKKFFEDRNVLLLAVTWPATWLKERGCTWSAERYFQVLRTILVGIKSHGATGEIRYFPGYLLRCVQDHFRHNSDAYCDEGKKTRNAWEMAIGKAMGAARADALRRDEAAIDLLAQAHRVVAVRRTPTKVETKADPQGLLFGT